MRLTKYCIVVGISGVELPNATTLVLIKNTLEILKNKTHTTSASQNLLYLHNVAQKENT
jgi:hypothetical protein